MEEADISLGQTPVAVEVEPTYTVAISAHALTLATAPRQSITAVIEMMDDATSHPVSC